MSCRVVTQTLGFSHESHHLTLTELREYLAYLGSLPVIGTTFVEPHRRHPQSPGCDSRVRGGVRHLSLLALPDLCKPGCLNRIFHCSFGRFFFGGTEMPQWRVTG
jgi:hypothetical protein